MDAALVCKTENFNLIATNAALMKLTIMYLYNNFNLQKVYWYYGSLVKMLHKLDLILELFMKNHLKKVQNYCFWYYTNFWRSLKKEL